MMHGKSSWDRSFSTPSFWKDGMAGEKSVIFDKKSIFDDRFDSTLCVYFRRFSIFWSGVGSGAWQSGCGMLMGGGDPVRGRYAAGNHLAGLSRKHPSVKLDPQRRCASSVLEISPTDLYPPDRAVTHLWLKANSRSLFGKWRQVSTIVESWLYLALDSEIFGAFQKGLEWTEKCPQRPLNMLRVSFGVCGMVDYEICLPWLDFETR